MQNHSVWDFDSPAAHAQAARLLELWPGGANDAGWKVDPIAEVARYLWTRNGDSGRYAPVIARTLDHVARVPRPLLAEAKLAAGDFWGAQRLAQSADDAGSMEWSRYLLALTRMEIRSGNLSDAEKTFRQLPPAVVQTYEARLTRSELDAAPSPRLIERTAFSSCSTEDEIPISGSRGWQSVTVHFRAATPTLIDLGVNAARSATLLIDENRAVTFRFLGFADQTLWFKRLSGGSDVCVEINRLP